MGIIALPTSLDAAAALDFAAGLSSHLVIPEAIIDFASLRSVEPFGLLYAGAALRTFFRQREYRGIGAQGVSAGEPAHEYLARVVTQSNQMKVNSPLAYCLREVIRNVFLSMQKLTAVCYARRGALMAASN